MNRVTTFLKIFFLNKAKEIKWLVTTPLFLILLILLGIGAFSGWFGGKLYDANHPKNYQYYYCCEIWSNHASIGRINGTIGFTKTISSDAEYIWARGAILSITGFDSTNVSITSLSLLNPK